MSYQSVLDLTPAFDLFSPFAAERLEAGHIEYRRTSNLRALTRRSVPDFEHLEAVETWNIEPYRGVEFETLAETDRALSNRKRILVNPNLPEILARELAGHGTGRLTLVIGETYEAYPSAEGRFELTRSVLAALEASRGHQIEIETRSPLVLRDLDLLARLDLSHALSVRVPMATLDSDLSERLEPNRSNPASRLEIVRTLARNGIGVVVSCKPILPGLNNTADALDPLFDAVHRAGALDLVADDDLAHPKHRRRLATWLETHLPERADAIVSELDRRPGHKLLGTFDRLRLSYGFPVHRAGRG